jgi:DNA-directed RNA polymerase specialized sigma24 family protein
MPPFKLRPLTVNERVELEEKYRKYAKGHVGRVARATGNRSMAEDLVQDAFIRFVQCYQQPHNKLTLTEMSLKYSIHHVKWYAAQKRNRQSALMLVHGSMLVPKPPDIDEQVAIKQALTQAYKYSPVATEMALASAFRYEEAELAVAYKVPTNKVVAARVKFARFCRSKSWKT